MAAALKTKKEYDESSISVLEGLDPVRVRPAMYIGATDKKGLHHLVWEIVDNSVDEYLNGFADQITVTLHKPGDSVTIADNGRGIPVGLHPKYKRPTLELILTTLHSGAKFGKGDDYIRSGGLHGVGSSVVNALSRKLIAVVRRDGFEYRQTFKRGKVATQLEKVGPFRGHGTLITFEADPEIFKVTHFDRGVDSPAPGGYVLHPQRAENPFPQRADRRTARPVAPRRHPGVPRQARHRDAEADRAPEPDPHRPRTTATSSKWPCSGPNRPTRRSAATSTASAPPTAARTRRASRAASSRRSAISWTRTRSRPRALTINAEDIREGVVGILSVFMRDPAFQGQTKEKLNNPEMNLTVESFVRPALESWLNANMTAADQIVDRINMAARAREASREAVQEIRRKSATQRRLNLPGKLADCKASDLDDTELFIVEGDSAGGSAKQGRNNHTQAILPLRGKILNSEGLGTSKVLVNQELSALVTAIGTGAGADFNIGGLRYGKIILLMDADADGYHITTLLLTFFFRHMPELIKKGPSLHRPAAACTRSPLARRTSGHATTPTRKKSSPACAPTRSRRSCGSRGSAKCSPAELAETTLDPRERTLLRVTVDSLLEADKMFMELLGKDPAARYRFIMDSATQVGAEELDV